MKTLKKAGVCAGAALGGAVGGAVSLVGKVIRQPEIDRLGETILDSAILTGEIAGHVLSGTADVISGAVKRDKASLKSGGRDLKRAGKAVADNVAANAGLILTEAGNVAIGIKTKNRAQVMDGLKTMGKMAAVEFFTVGAIKMDDSQKKTKKELPRLTVVRIIPSGPVTVRVFPSNEEISAHQAAYQKIDKRKKASKKRAWRRFFGEKEFS